MYACICRSVTESDVRQAGHAGVTAPEDLIVLFGLNDASCCGRCARQPDHLVALASEGAGRWEMGPAAMPSAPRVLTGAARALVQAAFHRAPAAATLRRREA